MSTWAWIICCGLVYIACGVMFTRHDAARRDIGHMTPDEEFAYLSSGIFFWPILGLYLFAIAPAHKRADRLAERQRVEAREARDRDATRGILVSRRDEALVASRAPGITDRERTVHLDLYRLYSANLDRFDGIER